MSLPEEYQAEKLLERVEEVFKRLGYAVLNLPLEQVV